MPWSVCDALYQLGVTDVCRYADKSAFDDHPLTSGDCQSGAKDLLCGGGCGGCDPTGANRCTGRSADRPHGVCVFTLSDHSIPCSYDPDPKLTCDSWLCAAFIEPGNDNAVAAKFGNCMPPEDCLAAAKLTPLRCLDNQGNDLAK